MHTMRLLILLLYVFMLKSVAAQPLSVRRVTDAALVTVLCSLDSTVSAGNEQLSVRVYRVANPAGSARMPGTDEVSYHCLVAVFNGDAVPERTVFRTADIIYPRTMVLTEQANDSYRLTFTYGPAAAPKIAAYTIRLNGVIGIP